MRVPQLDAFQRGAPPGRQAPEPIWRFAQELIDFGNSLYVSHRAVRAASPTRDLVMAALVRRALVIAEAIRAVVFRGLPEAALPLLRTLLDVRLSASLIVKDSSEHTAKRLAAYHYFAVQRHQQRILSDPITRDVLEQFEGARDEAVEIARRNKGWFESDTFREVRDEIEAGRPWHGFARVEDAFRAAGLSDDYFQTYDTGSLFTHVANIDFDFDSIVEGRVNLKGLLSKDTRLLGGLLGLAMVHLHAVLGLFVTDKELSLDPGTLIADGKHRERLEAIEAVGILLSRALPVASNEAAREA